MPFNTNTSVMNITQERETSNPQATTSVTFGETLSAMYQDEHTITNLAQDAIGFFQDTPDSVEGYSPYDEMEGYEAHADTLRYAESPVQMTQLKRRIDEETQMRETISMAGGFEQLGAAAIVAATDPVSWIPVAGPAYRTYRTGGSVLKGAAQTSGMAAAIETGREAYMQNTQLTRPLGQSIGNIASVTVLTGMLGGTAAFLSPAQRAEMAGKIDFDMSPNGIGNDGLSTAGAAQVSTTLEQEGIKGLSKTTKAFSKLPDALTNPVFRGSVSESKYVRQTIEKLADTSLIRNKNSEGIASAVSVENKIKGYDTLKYNFYKDFGPKYDAYAKRTRAEGGNKVLSIREFSEEITKANRRNDSHEIPEVEFLAKAARERVFNPTKKRMVDTGLLDDYDIDVKTADSWARRMWDRDVILARREEFKDINVRWLETKRNQTIDELANFKAKYEVEIKAKDAKILKDLERLEFKASQMNEEISDVADQLIDRIVGLPSGRLGYDITLEPKSKGPQKLGARGSAKARVYDIPDEMVEEFLVNDTRAIIDSHVRTVGADAELMDTFGSLDFDGISRQIAEDYNRLINKAKGDAKKTRKLEKQKRKDIADLQAVWEKLRGVYAQPDDYAAPQHVAERAFMAWNYARLLGGMTLSAIPDMGRHVMVHGVERTMKDGIGAMIKDFKGYKMAGDDVLEAGTGLDMVLSSTALARANIDEMTPSSSRVDAISSGITDGFNVGRMRVPSFGTITLMNQWNTAQKKFAGVMTQTRMMRAVQELGTGKKIDQKELENLTSHGIDADMSKRIADQFKKHGETRDNVLVPNARSWDDAQAAATFRAAVRKQVDETIITPGQDRPLWMSRPGWRMVGQFRSFAFSSMQRTTMAGLQQADAATLNGVLMMIGMGAMVYGAKNAVAGRETSDDPRVWITEGIDRSGLTGWFFDVNNISEKATRGTIGVNSLIGGPQMSRYASRNVVSSILGPSLGLSETFFTATGSAFSGDWKESDTTAMRRLLPYQNVVYMRELFDQMESGVNNVLGVQ